MKIAMVSEHTDPLAAYHGEPTSGACVHVTSLSRQLAKLGHRVTVYARRSAPELPERARIGRGVSVEYLAAGPDRPLAEDELVDYTGAFGSRIAAALEGEQPEVVHAHGWTSGLAALSAVRNAAAAHSELPIVQTLHSLNASEQRAGLPERTDRARMETAISRRADSVLVGSADQLFELASLGVPRKQISVVPYGVDADHFTSEGVATNAPWKHRKEERSRVVAVSDLAPASGADLLIQAMARIPNAELILAGGPPSEELAIDSDARRLEHLAKEAGVDDRVTLLGAVDRKELPRLLRSASVFASAALYSPYNGAVLEAMACGLPVVTTAVGGATDAVVEGTTGFLLPRAHPQALSQALRRLLSESTIRTAFGIAAIDRARARFTWQRVADETVRAYQGALSHPAGKEEEPLAVGDGGNHRR